MAAKDLKFLLYVLGLISVGNCVRYDCKNMLPSQTVPYKLMTDGSPFMLHIVGCNPHCVYRPGGKITVYLRTKDPQVHFTSFIVKARLPSGSESTGSPVGRWEVEPQGGARLETCNERERSVVRNVNEDPHDAIKLTWNAPAFDDSPGTVEFIASAMSSNGELWKFSSVLVEEDNTPLPSTKPPTRHPTTRHPTTQHSTTRHPTHTPTSMPAHVSSSTSGPPVPSSTTHSQKTHKPTPRPTHAVPDVEKEGTDQSKDDNEEAAPRNQEEGTGPRNTGEDPNEPEAREKEEMEDAKRHDEQGPDAGPNPDHDLDQEDVAFVKWQEKQQHLMDDEDQNSEGWQAEEARDKAQREAEYKWELETYERNKYNDEKEREERIRAEIMDKEEHDKVERTTTTTTTKPKPTNVVNIIDDDKIVDVDGNGIKTEFNDQISGSSRMVYSFASLLMTMLVLLV